jgi:hypothetical protein
VIDLLCILSQLSLTKLHDLALSVPMEMMVKLDIENTKLMNESWRACLSLWRY